MHVSGYTRACHVYAAVCLDTCMPLSRPDYCAAEKTIEKKIGSCGLGGVFKHRHLHH
jgi:hypothetical protein